MATIAAEDRTALTELAAAACWPTPAPRPTCAARWRPPSGYDPELWRQLAEMGVVGLVIDEATAAPAPGRWSWNG